MSASADKTKLLYWTVRNQNKYDILKFLQREKVDVNERNENGDTALHLIIQNENLAEEDMTELLAIFLRIGLHPNIKNNKGLTALHMAVARRYRSTVEFLMNRNANINESDCEGNWIAHFFVEDESEKFFKLLKPEGGPTKIIKSNKYLQFVDGFRKPINEVEEMEGESTSFVKWLIKKGFDFERKNKKGKSPLHLSIEYNLEHILHVLLQRTKNVCIDYGYNNALLHLFFDKNDVCEREYRHDVLRKNWSSYASRYASDIVKWIIDKKISSSPIDLRDRKPLGSVSSATGEESIMEMLVDHLLKSCPQSDLATTVFLELMKSDSWREDSKLDYFFDILRSLIAKGADVNAKDRNGKSALYSAFEGKNQRAIELLNDQGADFTVLTKHNENLFHALAKKLLSAESDDIVQEKLFELLASKGGCDVNAKDNFGKTPLHLASRDKNVAVVRKLLECGAAVDCKDGNLHTPLNLAVRYRDSEEVAELLLEKGADVNSRGRDGLRLLYFVAAPDKRPVLPVLLKWGAYVNAYALNKSPFLKAIVYFCSCNAKEMLMYGADINDQRIISLLRVSGPHEWSKKCRHSTSRPLLDSEISLFERARKFAKEFLLSHWIKLKTAELPCSMEYESFVNYAEYQQLYEDCLKEIATMKATFIDSCTSIFTFLHMDFGRRRAYINNERIQNLVNSPKLEEQFPNYAVVILASYRETVSWRSLLEPAKRAWLQLTNVNLLDECIERIFVYLKIEDLVSMIEHDQDA